MFIRSLEGPRLVGGCLKQASPLLVTGAVAVFCIVGWVGHLHNEIASLKSTSPGDELNDAKLEKHSIVKRGAGYLEGPHGEATYGGATYIRWGRTVCPDTDGTQLVYKGIMGGSQIGHGGSAKQVCLPRDPEWNIRTTTHELTSFIYGAEFKNMDGREFTLGTTNAQVFDNQNIECAVCLTSKRRSQVMIPAANSCSGSWTKEYDGYLMAAKEDEKRTHFNCVDHDPETAEKGKTSQTAVYMYAVQTACGSLPCTPSTYVEGRELTCVVCTLGHEPVP